jgi:beta-galactosidase
VPKGSDKTAVDHDEKSYYDPTYSYRLRWNNVVYEPGELIAVGYKDGKEVGRAKMRTAGAPNAIRLTPDRTKVNATGDDLCYLLVEAVDRNGVLCPLVDNLVHFDVTGPGEIVGVGNGNPMSLESFTANERKLFFGKAMLIVRTVEGKTGKIQATAKSAELAGTATTIEAVELSSGR